MTEPKTDARPRVSPFCQHLTSKKKVMSQEPPLTAADVLDASNHCWCARTQTVVGPDRFLCHPDECGSPERGCFESPLKNLL